MDGSKWGVGENGCRWDGEKLWESVDHMTEKTERLSEQELCPDALLAGQEEAFARDIKRLQSKKSDFIAVNCPACDHGDSPPVFSKFGFQYLQCPACKTIYMSPRPSPEVMASYYSNSENYRYWAEHIFPASEAARREKINRPWLARILEICEKHGVVRNHLLEVGPGFGTFSALVNSENAFRLVTAVEPTPEMAKACRERGVNVVEKSVEKIEKEVPHADVVVAFEVVEHLFEPKKFFTIAARLLAPGGVLVISCPNGLGFDIATLGAQSLAVDAEHVNLFNPTSIRRLGEACGLVCLEVSTPGRLDAEFVRTAALAGRFDLAGQPLLRRVLLEEWESVGWEFQKFLSKNNLSAHMLSVFKK
jgi:2-polyprenyl-3-methyl-5-hydroxy-6-metoxy-1,4-benzoquinol methylase/ribosomal protein S27E